MAQLAVAFKAIPALLGIGGGAASAGAIGTLSTVLGGASALMTTMYQRNIAKMEAATADDNAKRAVFASQVNQQDRDMEAAVAIASAQEARTSSGFAATSGTFQRADRRNRVLARRDSERIRQEGLLEGSQYAAQAAASRAEAQNLGFSAMFDAAGSYLNYRSSLINDASLVASTKANQINRIRVTV